MGFGPLWRGCWAAKREAFTVTRLTVGVPNELQMARNMTGDLPLVYKAAWQTSGHSEKVQHPLTTRDKRGTPEGIGVTDCKTDNGENARMHETNTYAK